MTTASTHIIRSQELHVTMEATETEGLSLQRTLSGLCNRKLTPLIGRVLDSVSSPDVHVCIERLEIDVGAINLERLEQDLAETVAQELEKQIKIQISNQIHPPVNTTQSPISGNIRYLTAQDRINKALIHFLTTGSLPWSFSLPAGQSLEQCVLEAWQESAGNGRSPLNPADFTPGLLAAEPVRKRVTRQFTSRFLTTFVSLLATDARQVVSEILHPMHTSGVAQDKIRELESCLWETLLDRITAGRSLTTLAVVEQTLSRFRSGRAGHPALADLLEIHWTVLSWNPPINNEEQKKLERGSGLAAVSHFPERIPENEPHPEPEQQNRTVTALQNAPFTQKEGAAGERAPDPVRHPDAQEGIYVGNAGLVLLHPFLPRFFTALGVASEDSLIHPGRALCLLHFLATGQAVAPEYELALPKILCNIPLEAAAEFDVSLTDAELEEAAALLKAVIRHWEVLRNTSPDGLRGTYLLRPGKLFLRGDDWVLQVESKSFDILLDQLPWGFSMIKLPWMDRLLWVEWSREC